MHYEPGRQGRRSVDAVSWPIPSSHASIFLAKQGIAPGAARRYAPADGSSTVAYRFAANQAVMDPKIAADLRPSADGSAVHACLVAGSG